MSQPISYNAKIAAPCLFTGCVALSALTFLPAGLAPIRLFTLMLLTFAVWAFCDEMGLRKPLNRAGFVLFVFAIAARASTLVDVSPPDMARRYILYAFAITGAILFWSAAFLHRDRGLKLVGAIGAAATLTPIALLIAGHIVVGTGATYGITSLFSALEQSAAPDPSILNNFDYLFSSWGVITSIILWRGLIRNDVSTLQQGIIVTLTRINPQSLAAPVSNYSQAVLVDEGSSLLYVSGQLGLDQSGHLKEGFGAQMRQAMGNLFAVLAEAGMTPANLVKLTVYAKPGDPETVNLYRTIRDELLIVHAPAALFLFVSGFSQPKFLVEIDAIAAA